MVKKVNVSPSYALNQNILQFLFNLLTIDANLYFLLPAFSQEILYYARKKINQKVHENKSYVPMN